MLPVGSPAPYSGSAQSSSPAIGPDGTIYVGCCDSYIYAINPNEHEEVDAAAGRRHLFFPRDWAGRHHLHFLGLSIARMLPCDCSRGLRALGPSLRSGDGSFGGGRQRRHHLYGRLGKDLRLDPAGHHALDGARLFGLTRAGRGWPRYLVGASRLYAVDRNGATVWSFPLLTTSYIFSSPVIGPDSTVYIVAGPYLWAFYGSSPPEQSPWAMFRREPTHNARAIQRALTAPARQPNGAFSMRLGLDIDRTYEVQASSDLFNWTVLTNFTSTSYATQFTDQAATNFPQRFYRLAVSMP